jgi:hypothetical protein
MIEKELSIWKVDEPLDVGKLCLYQGAYVVVVEQESNLYTVRYLNGQLVKNIQQVILQRPELLKWSEEYLGHFKKRIDYERKRAERRELILVR